VQFIHGVPSTGATTHHTDENRYFENSKKKRH